MVMRGPRCAGFFLGAVILGGPILGARDTVRVLVLKGGEAGAEVGGEPGALLSLLSITFIQVGCEMGSDRRLRY